MDRDNIKTIIQSIELLLNSLKMELNVENNSMETNYLKNFESVHPLEDDDIEYYDEE